MSILAAVTQNTQPDYVALAMVLCLALIVAIMAIRKKLSAKSKAAAPVAASAPAQTPVQPKAPGSAGQVKLHGVDPKIAAMLMAIIADKTGKPLNELRFISIKEVQ